MEMEWKIILGIGGVLAVLITFFQAGKWVGNVNSDRTKFEEFMSEIRDDEKKFVTHLPPNLTSSTSPIKLTELGEKVSKSTNAKEWAIKVAKELFEETEGKDAFEIQEFSFGPRPRF